MGRDSTTSPSRERNRSGDADATWQPTAGMRTTALYGAGLPSASAAPRAATSPPGGSGAESRRVRFTWYTSPAAIDARIERTPSMNSGSVSELVQAVRVGPHPRRAGPGAGGAHVGEASADRGALEGEHDGPEAVRVERGQVVVRSTRSVARRPPTTASGICDREVLHLGGDGSGHHGSVRSPLGPAGKRSTRPPPFLLPWKAVAPVHVEFTEEHDALRRVRARVRRGRDRAARGGVGPRPPLPGRRRAGDGRPRAVRHPVPGGVRRGRWRPHDAVHRDRGAGARRPLDGDHPRGRGGPRSQPDPQVRHGGTEADVAARSVRRADASVASGSPSRRRAATPAAPARPPCSTTRRGSG